MPPIADQRSDDAVSALDTWLSFDDLRRAGIVVRGHARIWS